MNNYGGYNPGNLPPKLPEQPNNKIGADLSEAGAAINAINNLKPIGKAHSSESPVILIYQPLPSGSLKRKSKGNWIVAVFGFFVMSFLTFVFGGMAFALTRKLPVAVAVWLIGLLFAVVVSFKIWRNG